MTTLKKKRKISYLCNENINKVKIMEYLENDLKVSNKNIINFIDEILFYNLTLEDLFIILNNYDLKNIKLIFNTNNTLIWAYIYNNYHKNLNNIINNKLNNLKKKIFLIRLNLNKYLSDNFNKDINLDKINHFLFLFDDCKKELVSLSINNKKNIFNKYIDNLFNNINECENKLLFTKENICLLIKNNKKKMIDLNESILRFNDNLEELIPSSTRITKEIMDKLKADMIRILSNYKYLLNKMNDLLEENIIFNFKETNVLYNEIYNKYLDYQKNLNNLNYMHY